MTWYALCIVYCLSVSLSELFIQSFRRYSMMCMKGFGSSDVGLHEIFIPRRCTTYFLPALLAASPALAHCLAEFRRDWSKRFKRVTVSKLLVRAKLIRAARMNRNICGSWNQNDKLKDAKMLRWIITLCRINTATNILTPSFFKKKKNVPSSCPLGCPDSRLKKWSSALYSEPLCEKTWSSTVSGAFPVEKARWSALWSALFIFLLFPFRQPDSTNTHGEVFLQCGSATFT